MAVTKPKPPKEKVISVFPTRVGMVRLAMPMRMKAPTSWKAKHLSNQMAGRPFRFSLLYGQTPSADASAAVEYT